LITLQYSRSTELVSLLIAAACRSDFSHVDIVLKDGTLLGASDSPNAPYLQGNPRGVAIRPPDYQPFAIRRQAHLKCSPEVEENFLAVAKSQLGEPFDNSAMKAVFKPDAHTGRDWRDADAWFCSEHVAWCLEVSRFFLWELLISKDRVTPPDLILITNFAIANADTFYKPIPGLKLGSHEI
jgi:hypothetical protein